MKPAPFEYVRPETVEEALEALSWGGEDAKVLAGGQSLMPLLAFRLARVGLLVDVNRLSPELSEVGQDDGWLRIPALARQREVERSPVVATAAEVLPQALRFVAHPAIRNRGTVVGSICHGDPASELCAVALALDGVLEVRSERGQRELPVEELLLGPFTTSLEPVELAIALRLRPPAGWRWRVHEVSRRAGDFAITGVVVGVSPDRSLGRAAVFGAAPRAYRVDAPSGELAQLAMERAEPTSDIHAEAGYRRHLVGVLVRRALRELGT
jgi:carbon-monoxide dehydrogenase medium subunit